MTYNELKEIINEMDLQKTLKDFNGFEESFEFEHFKTFYALIDEPKYTLMQFKDSEEFNTSSEQWVLCIPKDGSLCVIDMGTEEEICEQFLSLIEILKYGFGTAQIREKTNTDDAHEGIKFM